MCSELSYIYNLTYNFINLKYIFLYLISRLLETSILAARMTRLNVWKCGLGVWCYLYGSASVKSPKEEKEKKEVKKHLGESEFWQAERKESLLGDWTNKGKTEEEEWDIKVVKRLELIERFPNSSYFPCCLCKEESPKIVLFNIAW